MFVSVVSLLYWNREFRCFNWTETNRRATKQFDTLVFFSESFGLFLFVSKRFCLFPLFRYRFETPKQTNFFVLGFMKQTRADLVLVEPKKIFPLPGHHGQTCLYIHQSEILLFRQKQSKLIKKIVVRSFDFPLYPFSMDEGKSPRQQEGGRRLPSPLLEPTFTN